MTTVDIYKGVVPFIGLQVLAVALVFYFPKIATWLPTPSDGDKPHTNYNADNESRRRANRAAFCFDLAYMLRRYCSIRPHGDFRLSMRVRIALFVHEAMLGRHSDKFEVLAGSLQI